jgi:2-polyprenyl-6-methoxyphenol hydroxylase-like FAD-dependent oxidoreductase
MDYDVIIVGGRPAGASLAARLGKRGLRVLVVDRATFPSNPSVPSSPAVHSGAMALLDEIGIAEADYADDHACMRALHLNMAGAFTAVMPVPQMAAGRNYVRGIDRYTFDDLLWRNLARFPSVERRAGFNVTNVLHHDGRVAGIVGGNKGEKPREITARCVVGADGRFSFVARKVGAEVVEEAPEHTSTVYYADWVGVKPIHDKYSVGFVYATARGLDLLFFAMPGGRWSVNTHARSDRVRINGDAQRYYLETLRSVPGVWQYFDRGEQTSEVVGIKQIGNGYRRSSGPGWVLVGDALHYKDPADGQGIYDALIGAKILDASLARWSSKESSWEAAMASYRREVWAATHSMYVVTVGRIKRELYSEPPMPVIRSVLRWMMTDPEYAEIFLRVQGRDCPPEALLSKTLAMGAIARGARRDVISWITHRLSRR